MAASRTYVQEDIYDAFVEKVVEATKKLKVGNPFEEGTTNGPIVSEE